MNSLLRPKSIAVLVAVFIACGCLITGCACVRETGKKIWGSSTQALEKARGKGKVENFSCSLSDCFDACLAAIKEEKATVFEKDKKRGFIVALNFLGAIDTTEVGFFFEKGENDTTKIEITCLNPKLLVSLPPRIFSNIAKQIKTKNTEKSKEANL